MMIEGWMRYDVFAWDVCEEASKGEAARVIL
jgi:hypothetical protein